MSQHYDALHGGGWVTKTLKKKRDILYGWPLKSAGKRSRKHNINAFFLHLFIIFVVFAP